MLTYESSVDGSPRIIVALYALTMIKSNLLKCKPSKEAFECVPLKMDSLLDNHFSCGFTVQELKLSIRAKLLRPIGLLRTTDSEYMHVEKGNLADAYFNSDLERNFVFLWAAFAHDDVALLQKLRQQGANVNFTYPGENLNALHLSALRGSVECARWLLKEGCAVIDTYSRLSPLHCAVFGCSLELCRLLVENGCRADAKALHMAVRAGSLECIEYLLELKAPINGYDESGTCPLHVAADIGDVRILRLLLNDERLDVNAKTVVRRYTALHLAAENGNHAALTLLLENGVDVDPLSEKQQTPLYLACKEMFVDCVHTLLEYGAAINAQDHEKRTPLHAAVSNGLSPMQIHVVRLLTEREANVHLADEFGYTALHTAALNELDECVAHLILSGANATAKTNGNMTAFNIMKRKTPTCREKIVERLDSCLSYNTDQLLKFSFRDINQNSVVGEISYLYTLQKEGGQKVLEHPVCQAFLYLKWQRVRPFIVSRIVISLLTVMLLSSLVAWGIKEPICYRQLLQPVLGVCSSHKDGTGSVPSIVDSVVHQDECTLKELKVNLNGTQSPYQFPEISCSRNTCKKENVISMTRSLLSDSNVSTINVVLHCDNEVEDEFEHDHRACHPEADFLNRIFETYPLVPSFAYVFIMLMLVANIVRLIFTIPAYKSMRHFLLQYSNIMEMAVTVCVSLTLVNLCTKNMEERIFEKSFASLTLLISWSYMMITVSQLPAIGTYVAMFNSVLKEFVKMIISFLCVVMGFTFTFYTLKKDEFPNPIIAFTKVMAMMTGELDSGDLLAKEEGEHGVSFQKYTTAFVLTVFLVSITIVLMNLLVGIAVNDVEGLRKNANLSRLIQQTKLIYFLEKACFRGFLPAYAMNFLRKFMYMWPDSYTGIVLYVRPSSPNEKRLPREIMEEGIARLNKNKLKEKNKKQKAEQRMKKVEEQIQKVYDLVRNLPETIAKDVRNCLDSNLGAEEATAR